MTESPQGLNGQDIYALIQELTPRFLRYSKDSLARYLATELVIRNITSFHPSFNIPFKEGMVIAANEACGELAKLEEISKMARSTRRLEKWNKKVKALLDGKEAPRKQKRTTARRRRARK